jgi:hypothetical protein
MKINDKEWLERLLIGYKVYKEEHGGKADVEHFIVWMYKQYGIVLPKEKKKGKK